MPDTVRRELRAAIDAVMATAWEPPAEPSEEALLKADAEARRFVAEWDRLSKFVQFDIDQEAIRPIFDHVNCLVEYLVTAPVQSAATAAASMRHLTTNVSANGIDANQPDEMHFAGFGRILEWLEASAASQSGEMEPKPARPEIVAAVNAALAEGWNPLSQGILTDENLIAAEREIDRLWQEHGRIYEDIEQRRAITDAEEEELGRLWDHADELTEMALKAPVAAMPGALAMLRLLRKHPLEREVEVWQEFYPAAMDRALAVIEGQAGESRP